MECTIIALGVNDLLNARWELGSIEDIHKEDYRKNAPTFAGYYAQIIQKLKTIQPRAKFFLVTMLPQGAWDDEGDKIKQAHRDLLAEMCAYFDNTYFLDLFTYDPACDEKFRKQYFLGNHMSPVGYLYFAGLVESYIDYIIRNNPREFADSCFIGTNLKR